MVNNNLNNRKFKVGEEVTATVTGKITRISDYYDYIEIQSADDKNDNQHIIFVTNGTDNVTVKVPVVELGDVYEITDGRRYVALKENGEIKLHRIDSVVVSYAVEDFFAPNSLRRSAKKISSLPR
jgi:hypothetical protein